MPSDVSTLAPNPPRQLKLPRRWWILALFVAAALVVVALPRALDGPPTQRRITLVNQTAYAVDVDVTGVARDGWMGLGTAERDATTVVGDVIDQGGTWIFRFDSQGLDGGELRLNKADLTRAGWRIVIPDAVGRTLAGKGATPTPPANY